MTFDLPDPVKVEAALGRRSLYDFVRLAWHEVDPHPFIDGWHIRVICEHLEAVSAGRVRRLVINLPPGMSKSTLTGVLWPAWDWINKDTRRFLYCSYDLGLMTRDAGKLVRLLDSEWYRARWGGKLPTGRRQAITDFRTKGEGGRFSTTWRGKATGRHAHIHVFDDPHKPLGAMVGEALSYEETDQLLVNTFTSRAVDPPTLAQVIVMQCLHPEDLGMRAASRGWLRIWFPMTYEPDNACPVDERRVEGEPLCPARINAEQCAEMQAAYDMVDVTVWQTQFQQRPTRKGGGIFSETWIDRFAVNPDDVAGWRGMALQSWDLTFKDKATSDYIAGQWWGAKDDHFYLLDEPVFRLAGFIETLAEIKAKASAWQAYTCLIEDKANGPAIIESLTADGNLNVEPFNPEGSKSERAHAVAPLWSAGRVHVVRGPHFDRWRKTLPSFPAVRRDDEIDAMTMALLKLNGGSALAQALAGIKAKYFAPSAQSQAAAFALLRPMR